MRCNKKRNLLNVILPVASLFMLFGVFNLARESLPNEISFVEGRQEELYFPLPVTARVVEEDINVLSVGQEPVKENINVEVGNLTVNPNKTGNAEIALSLFGVVPIKTVSATVLPTIELIPSGMAVGVSMDTDGIMVLGTGVVTGEDNEAKEPSKGLLKSGDLMKTADGVALDSKETLMKFVALNGEKAIDFVINRDGEDKTVAITPAFSKEDNCYKIGIWVRDSCQGIGTLTFYDEKTGGFGALGHGVYDIDTQKLMDIRQGRITASSIAEIKKGEKGVPGELIGAVDKNGELGEIYKNTDVGLYGYVLENQKKNIKGKKIPIALRQEVHEGPATILSSIHGDEIEEFDVLIESVSKFTKNDNKNDSKGMVIRITDEELLQKTGGIVQGMSGSPILQDGKLIGAVTHVFVQDPTKGYGVFIENMLKEEQRAVA